MGEARGDDKRRYEFALETNLGPSVFHRTKVTCHQPKPCWPDSFDA